MNPAEIGDMVQTMKKLGVLHLKTADVDITIAESALTLEVPKVDPEVEAKARAKLDEIKSLFQMNDSQLLDHLFPSVQPASGEEP